MRMAWLCLGTLLFVGCRETHGSQPDGGASTPVSSKPPVSSSATATREPTLAERADALAHRFIILDGHIDVPYRLEASKDKSGALSEDVSRRTPKGDFDYVRAKEGGLNAPFMSIYVPAKYEDHGAKKFADSLIDMVEGIAKQHAEKFALARTPAQVRANFKAGKISLLLGMENGSPIEHKLANVAHFAQRGIRYITLAHSKDNHIADSSYDERHTHKGLSAFGKQVVHEMNERAIMVDVSHITDDAFYQVLEESEVPVIASHSSCRHFTPGWPRNMSDEMIKKLAAKGGVIQINFGSGFIDRSIQKQSSDGFKQLKALLVEKRLDFGDPEAKPIIEAFEKTQPKRYASVEQVADHIDHVKKLVGIDHVGLGSDFDGVGDSLPSGLKDVSQYPNLFAALLKRGYTDEELEKLASSNVLRVWQAAEDYAAATAKR